MLTDASDTGSVLLTYKWLADGQPVQLEFYPPKRSHPLSDTVITTPAVVYFHGGGLTVGNRSSWFPKWLHKRSTDSGYSFISADYQLVPPATAHDVLQDIKDLFAFMADPRTSIKFPIGDTIRTPTITSEYRIDRNAICVAGSSAGGLCAYLAAMHCKNPGPRVMLSMYGMGGDFITPHYLTPKTEVFFRGREILNPDEFRDYLYPASALLKPIADSPLEYHPETYHIPGYPANPRMLLARLYLQLGVFLDYYTGEHEPSLSSTLRDHIAASTKYSSDRPSQNNAIGEPTQGQGSLVPVPACHLPLFPQFNITGEWPPTIFCHGSEDTAVPFRESFHLHERLNIIGVPAELIRIEGKEHSFDYAADAEEKYGSYFDSIMAFIQKWIDCEGLVHVSWTAALKS